MLLLFFFIYILMFYFCWILVNMFLILFFRWSEWRNWGHQRPSIMNINAFKLLSYFINIIPLLSFSFFLQDGLAVGLRACELDTNFICSSWISNVNTELNLFFYSFNCCWIAYCCVLICSSYFTTYEFCKTNIACVVFI